MPGDGVAKLFEKAREAPLGGCLLDDARQRREVADEIQAEPHVSPAAVTGEISGEVPLSAHGTQRLGVGPLRVPRDAADER